MPRENAIADHWGSGDVYALILAALAKAGKSTDAVTVEDLAPVDHFQRARFPRHPRSRRPSARQTRASHTRYWLRPRRARALLREALSVQRQRYRHHAGVR